MTTEQIKKAIQMVLSNNGVRSSYPERLKSDLLSLVKSAQRGALDGKEAFLSTIHDT